jgi:outer membrane protein assembly factor BamB
MSQRHVSLVAGAALLAVALSGCSTLGRLNPFDRDDGPQSTASAGERVSIVAFDQRVEASEALKDVGFSIPEPRDVSDWSQPGGNAAKSYDHVIAAPAFEIAWREGIGEGSGRRTQITAPPVIADGVVYTLDGDAGVTATRAEDGRRVWRVDLSTRRGRDREALGGGLAVADGRVIVASGYRFVAALDARTGAEVWRRSTAAPVHAAPTVSGGRVFVSDVDNQLLALDLSDGEIAWNFQALVEPARLLRASSPAVQGDFVVAPFSSGELVALRGTNGDQLWADSLSQTNRTNALSEIRDIAGRPVIYRDDVFAVSHSGVFSAVDLRTGERRWDLPLSGVSTPWPAGDVVYVVSKAGELIAANRDNGQVYWIRDLNEGRVKKKGGFLGFGDRTVRPIWAGPVLASNRLVLVNDQGEAVALDPHTGATQKTIRLGGPAYIAPAASNGMLYVVTDEGQLVAIR